MVSNGREPHSDGVGAYKIHFASGDGCDLVEEKSEVRLVKNDNSGAEMPGKNEVMIGWVLYILTEQGRQRPSSRYLRGRFVHSHRQPPMQ